MTCQAGHHRLEKRRFWQVPVEEVFPPTQITQWAGLQTLVIEQSSRTLWNKTTHRSKFPHIGHLPFNCCCYYHCWTH